MRCNLIAGMPCLRRGAQICLNARKRLALQTLRRRDRRCRRSRLKQRMVKHILTEAVALHAFSPAAEHIKRLPEPLIRERLDQIIHRAQSHGIVNRFCVIRRCDHDDIRVHAFRTKLQQQLGAAHLRHVNV